MDIITYVVVGCWAVFLLYWLISALKQKQTQEKPIWTLNNVVAQVLFSFPFVILIRPDIFGWERVLFDNVVVDSVGVFFCVLGLIICILARNAIASNWSKNLDFKKGHELVQHGPYKRVRHPIYTGFLSLFLGSALAAGTIGGLIGVVLLLCGCLLRIRQEEQLMMKHFKEQYTLYKQSAKRLIPYVF